MQKMKAGKSSHDDSQHRSQYLFMGEFSKDDFKIVIDSDSIRHKKHYFADLAKCIATLVKKRAVSTRNC